MKNNKFTEIRNRTAYIHDLLHELDDVIKEAELDGDINTKKIVNKGNRMVDATVNDLEEYEADVSDCKLSCAGKLISIGAIIVISIFCYLYVVNNDG